MPFCLALSILLAVHRSEGEAVVQAALNAMGGQAKVASIQKVSADFTSHDYALEESERPEGPWLANYWRGHVTTDFVNLQIETKVKANGLLMGGEIDRAMAWSRERPMSGYWFLGGSGPHRLVLGPERVLLTALSAKDLAAERPIDFHGIPHDVVRFSSGGVPVRILINRYTHLPAAVETVQLGQGFWTVWGDVTERVVYGNWDIAPGGVMLPTLFEIDRNGLHQEDISIIQTEIRYGQAPPIEADAIEKFDLPGHAERPVYPFKAVDIAPGVVQYQSGFNCAAVDQGDGVVILEGVVGTENMHAILDDVAKRFPNKPIKAVVSTDDAWPHIGGLRYFVANHIPIVAMPLNRPILDRLFKARFTILPDELAKVPASPIYRLVGDRLELGKGQNRLIVRPMRGSVTERMLYAFFPERKLLYAPDVIQRSADHWFNVNLVKEMLTALGRDHVDVEIAFAFHSGPIAISALRDAVRKAEAGSQ